MWPFCIKQYQVRNYNITRHKSEVIPTCMLLSLIFDSSSWCQTCSICCCLVTISLSLVDMSPFQVCLTTSVCIYQPEKRKFLTTNNRVHSLKSRVEIQALDSKLLKGRIICVPYTQFPCFSAKQTDLSFKIV